MSKLIWFCVAIVCCVVHGLPLDQDQPQTDKSTSSNHSVRRRVVGGVDASIYEAPFVVQLIRRNHFLCTGSIIAPDTILTAGHCAIGGVDFIVYGTDRKYSANEPNDYFQFAHVSRIHMNSGYRGGVKRNDIAILKLSTPVVHYNSLAAPIELEADPGQCGVRVRNFGFGRTSNMYSASRMQMMETRVSSNCFLSGHNYNFIETQINGQTACNGDSGGPLVGPNGRLIGLLSGTKNDGCVVGDVNLFVKVANHIDFIRKYSYQGVQTNSRRRSSNIWDWITSTFSG